MSTAVLTAIQDLITPTYERAYVVPGDWDDIVSVPPFILIEEIVGLPNRTVQDDYIGSEFQRYWTVGIMSFTHAGVFEPGSKEHIDALTANSAVRDALIQIILANPQLGGTVDYIGNTVQEIDFEDTSFALSWRRREYFGTLLGVPVKETIT